MKKIEIRRQLFHALVGLLFVVLISFEILGKIGSQFPLSGIYFLTPLARVLLLILILGIVLILLCREYQISGINWLLDKFERSHIRQKFPGKGAFLYLLGAFIISLFLEKEGVAASMLIVSVGDSISHLIGEEFGEIKHPLSRTKNAEGHVAGGILGGLGASFFIIPPIAFIAAFGSMFIEGIEFEGKIDQIMDDNLIVPLVSGIIILLSRTILF